MKRTVAALVLSVAMLLVASAPGSSQTQEQKRKWRQQVINTMKDTATAEESYRTDNPSYTKSLAKLKEEGLRIPRRVTIKVILADENTYCFHGDHDRLKQHWYYHSDDGRWAKGRCPTAG